jgi:ribosome-binding factor A
MRRVNELLKREIGMYCEREIAAEIKGLLTITAVKTSPDLRTAHVYFSLFSQETSDEEALDVLMRNRAEIQHVLARVCHLKYTPVLDFRPDHTPAEADHILAVLDELGVDSEEEEPASGGTEHE